MSRERFKDALWANQQRNILLCGAGGISSWTALFLARSNNHEITVIDFDEVENINLAGQFFQESDIGTSKMNALAKNVNMFTNPPIKFKRYQKKVQEIFHTAMPFEYVITGFDNMEARKFMYEKWKQLETRKLFVDGRLLAEQFEIYFVTPDREQMYEETLFDDKPGDEASCTYKSTSHFAAMCGAKIVQGLNAYLANEAYKDDMATLPFKYYEFGPTFTQEIVL